MASRDENTGRYQPEQTLLYQIVEEYYPAFMAHLLERQGLLERDAENSYLSGDAVDDDPMSQLCGHSITYRIAVGPVTPARRGRGNQARVADEPPTPAQRRASMTWAQRLKRVFNIDIETCRECGGAVKVIACIEDSVVIQRILNNLKEKGEYQDVFRLPESRGPP